MLFSSLVVFREKLTAGEVCVFMGQLDCIPCFAHGSCFPVGISWLWSFFFPVAAAPFSRHSSSSTQASAAASLMVFVLAFMPL